MLHSVYFLHFVLFGKPGFKFEFNSDSVFHK